MEALDQSFLDGVWVIGGEELGLLSENLLVAVENLLWSPVHVFILLFLHNIAGSHCSFLFLSVLELGLLSSFLLLLLLKLLLDQDVSSFKL